MSGHSTEFQEKAQTRKLLAFVRNFRKIPIILSVLQINDLPPVRPLTFARKMQRVR